MKTKKLSILVLFIFSLFFSVSCTFPTNNQQEKVDKTYSFKGWEWNEHKAIAIFECNETKDILEMDGEMEIQEVPATCEREGMITYIASINFNDKSYTDFLVERIPAYSHDLKVEIIKEATEESSGIRRVYCDRCSKEYSNASYSSNSYLNHGKLRVEGRDLVDQNGNPFQLYGISTHGLQWFGRYVNTESIISLQDNFGLNVLRLACYSSEGGWAEGGKTVKDNYKKYIDVAVKTAKAIGLYVIIDWHMLGAENTNDANPLYYMDEAKEFFEYVASTYKDYDNILYEIMNEPNGSTTWVDCKNYANNIIPIIRKYTDAVVLVGNPHWTADLNSVMNSPLTGFKNIMYTYHFYAATAPNTSQVVNAYDSGLPVFISEFGFMSYDGGGNLSYTNGEKWLKVLEDRNISYVAWSLANASSSSSMIKTNSVNITDFSENNLKEWGIYLRNLYRGKALLD